ncbi:aldo/keto reductase [Brachybacterium hainanense]|uniref:Aldo/keto reductase n=1 Tax=Brachybacterium hainanense TaxID=1541174 RepID=A0ABV6RA60_9MICO
MTASRSPSDRLSPATPLILGAMSFGTRIDEETSFAVLDRFVERGGRWIDTADCYAFWDSPDGMGGASERVLGRWLAARPGMRSRVLISTKAGAQPLWAGSWPAQRSGLGRRAVHEAVAGSLERLGVESVDLLWLHQEDRATPIEETVEAIAELVATGRVARVGASNHPAWRVERARAHAASLGTVPIDALQLSATYLRPRPGAQPAGNVHPAGVLSDEQRDYARTHRLEVWAYTALLGGAYDREDRPIDPVFEHPGSQRRLAALTEVAGATGSSRGQVVLAWLVAQGIRPILGGSTVPQLDAALDGAGLELSAEHLAKLDAAA